MGDTTPIPRRSTASSAGNTRAGAVPAAVAGKPAAAASTPAAPVRSRRRRWIRALAICLGILLIGFFGGGEAYLRWDIGLGDPPLMMADPAMHYRYVPSQTCMRLHHLVHYNAYSMRSDDFPPHKIDPTELRIVMIGDSVINGGSMTDQSDLVSGLLQKSLSDDLHRPVVVGNASAGGWGPPNELGWLQTFGTLDADIVILVLSSHNYGNAPQWPLPIGMAFDSPTRKPLLAWEEFLERYASRLTFSPPPEGFVEEATPRQSDVNWCFWSIQQIIKIAHAGGALVIVAQHAQRMEVGGHWKPGHAYNEAAARSAGADLIVQFEPAFQIARETGRDPYRPFDNIHPGKIGHQLMADELEHATEKLLESKDGQGQNGG
jgi:hypothetical protein